MVSLGNPTSVESFVQHGVKCLPTSGPCRLAHDNLNHTIIWVWTQPAHLRAHLESPRAPICQCSLLHQLNLNQLQLKLVEFVLLASRISLRLAPSSRLANLILIPLLAS